MNIEGLTVDTRCFEKRLCLLKNKHLFIHHLTIVYYICWEWCWHVKVNKMSFQVFCACNLIRDKDYISIQCSFVQYMFIEQLNTVSSIRGT